MVTIKEIAAKSLVEEKKKEDRNDIFCSKVARPISFFITVPCIEAGIKANTVSFISLVSCLLGFVFLGFFPSTAMKLLGIFFFFLWGILDCVDGNIARYTGKSSMLGVLWDAAAGYTTALIYLAMGLSVLNTPAGMIDLHIPDYCYAGLGGITTFFIVYIRLVMHKKMLLFSSEAGDSLRDKANFSIIRILALNVTAPFGIVTILMVIAVLFNLTREFVLGYFIVHTVITVESMRELMRE